MKDSRLLKNQNGEDFVRTPDACFEDLPGFPYAPNYVQVDGWQQHYVDEGPRDGWPVLLLYGQPDWSYLYRKMIPTLVNAGYRAIAPDMIGMGRSDKPLNIHLHTAERHTDWLHEFIEELGLQKITLFCQDWVVRSGCWRWLNIPSTSNPSWLPMRCPCESLIQFLMSLKG